MSYDNKTEKADTVKNSSYLCFNMKGSGTVTIVPEKVPMWEVYAIGGGAAAILIIALAAVIGVSRSKRRKSNTPLLQINHKTESGARLENRIVYT